MSEPMLGEIILFGGTFAPKDWAFCAEQLIPISENQAMYAILGTTWGGDGRTNFALPDYRGRVPIGIGRGATLTEVYQGAKRGTETTTLRIPNIPAHTHGAVFAGTGGSSGGSSTCSGTLNVATDGTDVASASTGSHLSAGPIKAGNFGVGNLYKTSATSFESLAVDVNCTGGGGGITGGTVAIEPTGSDQPFYIMQPTLGSAYLIAMQGLFPSRN